MGMLGGKCSECCGTKIKKCYAPKDTSGSCKRISDGTCSVESRCDCDTDGGDLYNPGGVCEDALHRVCTTDPRYHIDPGGARRQCGWIPVGPDYYGHTDLGTTPIYWFEPYFLVEGESCDACCSESNPDGSHRLVGMDSMTARDDDNCYCCLEPFDGSKPKPVSEFYVTVTPNRYLDLNAWWAGMSFRMKTADDNLCGNYTSDLLEMQGTEGDCTYENPRPGFGCGDPVPPNFWARCDIRTLNVSYTNTPIIQLWIDFLWTDYVPDWWDYPCECIRRFYNVPIYSLGKGTQTQLDSIHGIQHFLCSSDFETIDLKSRAAMPSSTITLSKNPLP